MRAGKAGSRSGGASRRPPAQSRSPTCPPSTPRWSTPTATCRSARSATPCAMPCWPGAGHGRTPARARGAVNGMVSRPRHGLSLCAGGGGLDLGLMLAEPGYHTRAFVEWEDWPRTVLIAAQRAGYFAPAPIWDDLRSFDARPFRGAFDIRPRRISLPALQRGRKARRRRRSPPPLARRRPRHRECRPEWVFLENVPVTSPSASKPSCESFGDGLHACGGFVLGGRSRRAAPAAAHLHPGPHR
jgi:hypothetical protein